MIPINLYNKKISILGMAKSGKALARVLAAKGAQVLVSDMSPREKMEDLIKELADLPLEWETGGHTKKVYRDKDLIVISPGVSIHAPIIKAAKEANIPVISEVEMAYLLSIAPFIAITGTNGKSTTSTLIHQMLLADGRQSFLAGNIGTPLVGEVEMIPENAWITAEISSFQLEAVDRFHPHVAVLTNITNDHIDRHGSFQEYKMAKANLFKNQGPGDFAVLNEMDSAVMSIEPLIAAKKLFFNRLKPVENSAYFQDGFIKARIAGKEKTLFSWDEVPLKGIHNLENVLATICVALALNVKIESALKAFQSFKSLHYRMEYVDTIAKKQFYNDSKGTNPDAVRASLESFKEPTVIIAGGTDKGLDFAPLADNIARFAYGAVLIGESRHKIAKALEAAAYKNYTIMDDMTLAGFKNSMKKAWEICPEGGVVLLSPSCASFDMFNRAEHRGEMFNIYVGELKEEYEKKV